MRRSDRLFEIIQLLRTASGPLTAAALSARLEVTPRTVYRDIAALQARRVPIDGAAGVGYVLRRGFDLPPLMFTTEEVEAIALGARLVRRLRDPALREAAESVLGKVAVVLPDALRAHLAAAPLYVSDGGPPAATGTDIAALRGAIRDSRKVHIVYLDEQGRRTRRTIRPIAMAYYVTVTLIAAWCELRGDFRHFRVDRIEAARFLEDRFTAEHAALMRDWLTRPQALAPV
jgi:predicted DNA-binding transcriptional regulator YafY